MSEMRSTHKRHRAVMEAYLRESMRDWQGYHPNSYKRHFSCYVYRNQEAVYTASGWGLGPERWRVEVGSDRGNYADFPLHKEDRAKAFAVELLLKGLCFKIIYRKPR